MKNTHSSGRQAYKPRPGGTLTETVTELIRSVGGLERAARLSRVSATSLQKYSDPDEDRHMPVDVVLALEAAAGAAIVTRFLAAELGCTVERIGAGGSIDLGADTAAAMRETADVIETTARALADGVVDEQEAGEIIRETDEAIEALQAVRESARQVARGGGGSQ